MKIFGDPWKTSTREINKQRARLKIIGQCNESEKLKQNIDEGFEKYGCEKEEIESITKVEILRDFK